MSLFRHFATNRCESVTDFFIITIYILVRADRGEKRDCRMKVIADFPALSGAIRFTRFAIRTKWPCKSAGIDRAKNGVILSLIQWLCMGWFTARLEQTGKIVWWTRMSGSGTRCRIFIALKFFVLEITIWIDDNIEVEFLHSWIEFFYVELCRM